MHHPSRQIGILGAAVTALLLGFSAAHAAEAPSVPPSPATASPAATERPPELGTLPPPAQVIERMADSLDSDANFVVARVAGEPITKGDVADVIRATPLNLASLGYKALFTRAMDELLRQKLAAASARAEGLDKDPAVKRREAAAAERALAQAWVDQKADAAVTDKMLHARYDAEVAGKPGPEEVRARVILVASEAQAKDLIAKIQAGADFADLARKYSKDMSADQGGDIGYVPLDALSAEVGGAMFALAPGQITAYPIHALPGYFILRVEGRRQRATPSFDEARPMLAAELRHEAADAAVTALTADIRLKGAGGTGGAAKPAN